MKALVGNSGYYELKLRKEGMKIGHSVHRLIARTFIEGFTEDMQVNHLDGNKLNNAASNLAACTQKENMQHAFDNGLHTGIGKTHYKARAIIDNTTGEVYGTLGEAAEAFGEKKVTLHAMLAGRFKNRTPLVYN